MKWIRRRPAIAAAVALALAIAMIGGSIITWQVRDHREALNRKEREREVDRLKAEEELRQAEEASERQRREEEAKVAAERRAKAREDYTRDVGLALREWTAGRPDRAEELLDACLPEMRQWEWRYVKQLCHGEIWRSGGGSETTLWR